MARKKKTDGTSGAVSTLNEAIRTLSEGDGKPRFLGEDGLRKLIGLIRDRSGAGDFLPVSGGTVKGDLTVQGTTALAAQEISDPSATGVLVAEGSGKVRKVPFRSLASLIGAADGNTLRVKTNPVTFPGNPVFGAQTDTDDIPLADIVESNGTFTSMECDHEGVELVNHGLVRDPVWYVGCSTSNTTGEARYATMRLTYTFDDGTQKTATVMVVQRYVVEGVFVAYTDADGVNRICAPDSWDAALGTPVGILVSDGSRELLVSIEETSKEWGMYGTLIDGVTTTTDSTEAKADFGGKDNTEALVRAFSENGLGGEDTAAGWCHAYSRGSVAAGDWWLPALGELAFLSEYQSEIDSAVNKVGGGRSFSGYYWSSTQYSSGSAWDVSVNRGNLYTNGKGNDYNVRPVSAFDYEI